METTMPLSAELIVLALSIPLLLIHIAAQGLLVTRERGTTWNAGPRDEEMPRPGLLAGRAGRALENFKETYPAFIAAVLLVVVAGRSGGWSEAGAWLWLAARLVYLPLYLAGTPYVRSLVWMVSMLGILLVLSQLL